MSSVAAIAKTPSEKVSRRAVGMALRFAPGGTILAEHAEGRIADAEVDLRDDDAPAAVLVQPERALVVLLRREDRGAELRGEQRGQPLECEQDAGHVRLARVRVVADRQELSLAAEEDLLVRDEPG